MESPLSNLQGSGSLEQVVAFQNALSELPQRECPTDHLIHGSIYARTIFIPAGTVLVGALTNLDNICIVNGDITVTTDDSVVRLTGYHVIPASKGYKRVGLAHSDTYWTTLIHTQTTSVVEAENEMTNEAHLLQTRNKELTQGNNPCHL